MVISPTVFKQRNFTCLPLKLKVIGTATISPYVAFYLLDIVMFAMSVTVCEIIAVVVETNRSSCVARPPTTDVDMDSFVLKDDDRQMESGEGLPLR